MGLLRHHRGRGRNSSWTICLISVVALLLLIASSSATSERDKLSSRSSQGNAMPRRHRRRGGDHSHDLGRRRGWEWSGVLWMRLVGPRSSPPTCRSTCGRCAPCRPVHMPIHPGRVSVPQEYYPEVWRCKCGNTIFMP